MAVKKVPLPQIHYTSQNDVLRNISMMVRYRPNSCGHEVDLTTTENKMWITFTSDPSSFP